MPRPADNHSRRPARTGRRWAAERAGRLELRLLSEGRPVTKQRLAELRKSQAGAIVNVGGLSAHTGSKHRAHVIAAKAGLVGFTRALAHDLAGDHVTANCVVPGLIGTPRPTGQPEPQHHQVNATLTGLRGAPDDIATVVRFLCGPGARFVTGQAIHVSGGALLT